MFKYVKSVLGTKEKARRLEPTISRSKPAETLQDQHSSEGDKTDWADVEDDVNEVETFEITWRYTSFNAGV